MRDKAPGKGTVHQMREAGRREAILPRPSAVGPEPQADGDPFASLEARPEREAAADSAYSIDRWGKRYYFHRDLRYPVIIRVGGVGR